MKNRYCNSVMQIAYIDGNRFRLALIAGARRLMEHAGQLNAINVFPVPDGDTGTNMAGTARTMIDGLARSSPLPLGETTRAAAEFALSGARGNSGAILAQFLYGLADELEHEFRIGARRFAAAAKSAAARTWHALSSPREGTILTVLKDWSETAQRLASRTDDLFVVLMGALDAARASLARTAEILPELRKAGVVDAGALGWIHFLEGIMAFISGGRIRDIARTLSADEGESDDAMAAEALLPEGGGSTFRYCTECLLSGVNLDLDGLRTRLAAMGDSVVVAGSSTRAKIHLHTDEPTGAFRFLETAGRLEAQKVDDMLLQRRIAANAGRPCAVLIDSACDLPGELLLELGVERVPVQVEVGGRAYLDRECLSPDEFYAMLRADPGVSVSTSQPSPASFARKLDLLLGHAGEAVYVGISGALSGTLEAGVRAAHAERYGGRVRVVDSLNISVGAALVARRAAEAAAAGRSGSEVAMIAEDAARRVRLLVAVPDLSGLIRSGRLGGVKGLAARWLGFRPIITIDPDGKAAAKGFYLGAANGVKALVSALKRRVPAGTSVDVLVAHADAADEAARLVRGIGAVATLEREILVTSVSPALAAHAGAGALALAFLPARAWKP
ncbi:MAG: DegV family EDD domain-containing protein [Spirochaetes bacterium]|nr:DegV family EDD domain-containing protein [Spirochaetota bacterium]